jgi:hypothetical protein
MIAGLVLCLVAGFRFGPLIIVPVGMEASASSVGPSMMYRMYNYIATYAQRVRCQSGCLRRCGLSLSQLRLQTFVVIAPSSLLMSSPHLFCCIYYLSLSMLMIIAFFARAFFKDGESSRTQYLYNII